jgi:hypothetical protein
MFSKIFYILFLGNRKPHTCVPDAKLDSLAICRQEDVVVVNSGGIYFLREFARSIGRNLEKVRSKDEE